MGNRKEHRIGMVLPRKNQAVLSLPRLTLPRTGPIVQFPACQGMESLHLVQGMEKSIRGGRARIPRRAVWKAVVLQAAEKAPEEDSLPLTPWPSAVGGSCWALCNGKSPSFKHSGERKWISMAAVDKSASAIHHMSRKAPQEELYDLVHVFYEK